MIFLLSALRKVYAFLLFNFIPNAMLVRHVIYSITYLLFLTIFRYMALTKWNHELKHLGKNNMGLYYQRIDKIGDVYKFSAGQFYEFMTINIVYKNRCNIISMNTHTLTDKLSEVLYLCMIYSVGITAFAVSILCSACAIGLIPLFILKYFIMAILAKNFLAFINIFRVINDTMCKIPINVFINLGQLAGPLFTYLIFMPFFNISLNFNTYIISCMVTNSLSFIFYYISICFTCKTILLPKYVPLTMKKIRDLYYLCYTGIKQMANHLFVDVFLLIFAYNMSYDDRIFALYIATSGVKSISGLFETPIDWTARVYVSKYRDTRDFIAASYLIILFLFMCFAPIFLYLISIGIYDLIMIIKFDFSKYCFIGLILASLSILSKMWELIVIAQRKDKWPICILFLGMLVNTIAAGIMMHYFNIPVMDAFIYGSMVNWITQYTCFMLRGHYLLKLEKKFIIAEMIRYMFIVLSTATMAKYIIRYLL